MKPRYTNLSSIEPHPDYPLKMYYASEADARIAELERLLREAQYFVTEDFPPAPIETLTIDDVCATPRYFQFWKDLNQALMVSERT